MNLATSAPLPTVQVWSDQVRASADELKSFTTVAGSLNLGAGRGAAIYWTTPARALPKITIAAIAATLKFHVKPHQDE